MATDAAHDAAAAVGGGAHAAGQSAGDADGQHTAGESCALRCSRACVCARHTSTSAMGVHSQHKGSTIAEVLAQKHAAVMVIHKR